MKDAKKLEQKLYHSTTLVHALKLFQRCKMFYIMKCVFLTCKCNIMRFGNKTTPRRTHGSPALVVLLRPLAVFRKRAKRRNEKVVGLNVHRGKDAEV